MNPATNYDAKIKTRIKLVHIAKHELHLDDDNYRAILSQWKKQGTRQPAESSKDLTWHQLGELLIYFKGLGFKIRSQESGVRSQDKTTPEKKESWKKYESSITGLKEEICDLAKARFGGDAWELPLNSFCARFGVKRWQWLDVSHGRAVKAALLRLSKPQSEIDNPKSDGEVPF